MVAIWFSDYGGSSPRLWGVSQTGNDRPTLNRFIPTPVGSMLRSRRGVLSHSVHPHACGEYNPVGYIFARLPGSSPRLWGVSL